MTCRELIEFLAEYVSGELPELERVKFDEHLAECPECVDYLKSYRATIRLGKSAFRDLDEPVPDEVPAELIDAILAARPKR